MALYHTYRPQTFADIVGQEHIVTTLESQVKNDKVAHAYLFSGPRGVGKTTSARILAKSVNCTSRKSGNSEPCNTCQSCEEISKSRSIDVIEIDAASHTGVDNVRQNIIDNAQFKPTSSKYKIFIIDEVHMLSTAAFNALLKTLEEPPQHVMFILATTDEHKLPATIISRCQRFTFTKVPDESMKKYIKDIAQKEGATVDDEVVGRIIRKSEGCARDAISLLDQIMAMGDTHITPDSASLILPTTDIERHITFTETLLKRQQEAGLHFVSNLVIDGVSLPHFCTDLIGFLRVLMIAHVDPKLADLEMDLNKDARTRLSDLAHLSSQSMIIALIDMAMRRASEIKSSPIPQLPLEMLVIEWCNISNFDNKDLPNTIETTQEKPKIKKTIPDIESKIEQEKTVEIQKTSIAEKVKQIIRKRSVTKLEVEEKWNDLMHIIEQQTPTLSFVLKMAKLIEVEDNTVRLQVQYKFHQEKLTDKTFKHKIETILQELFETRIKLEVIVDEQGRQQPSNELQNLASVLGGEVIH